MGERGEGLGDLADFYAEGIRPGVDPAAPDRWVRLDEHPQAKVEAASLALKMRGVLVDWTIGISSAHADAAAAVDTGASLLMRSAIAAVFHKIPNDAIVVHPTTKVDLEPAFELEDRDEYELFEIRGLKTFP